MVIKGTGFWVAFHFSVLWLFYLLMKRVQRISPPRHDHLDPEVTHFTLSQDSKGEVPHARCPVQGDMVVMRPFYFQ